MNKMIIGVLVVLGLAGAGYNYWLQTPEYSLLQIKEAIDTKDRYLFEKHVDLDRIVSQAVGSFLEFSLSESNANNGESMNQLGEQLGAGILKSMTPLATSLLKDFIADQFEEESVSDSTDREKSAASNLFSIDSQQRESLKNSLASAKKKYLTKEGKDSFLGIEITNSKSSERIVAEFRLQKKDNYWVVSEISNLEELFTQLQN
jgi:hypothetical protein